MSQEKDPRAAKSNPSAESAADSADWDDDEDEWEAGKPARNGNSRRTSFSEDGSDGLRRPKKTRKLRQPRS